MTTISRKPYPPAPPHSAQNSGPMHRAFCRLLQRDLPKTSRRTFQKKSSGKSCLPRRVQRTAAAFGATITTAAWKTKPSWFVIAGNDRAIPPELEKAEAARMKKQLLSPFPQVTWPCCLIRTKWLS